MTAWGKFRMKSRHLKIGLFATAAALAGLGFATAEAGTITGVVVDPAGKPVASATVSIPGTSYATKTGADGKFALPNVPQGQYTVEIEHPTYHAAPATVSAPQDGSVAVSFNAYAAQINEVVVVGNRYQATQAQMKAVNTVSVMSAADLQHTAVHNVAEALGLLPGVNVMNTGSGFIGGVDAASRAEGMFVSVRGMNAEYNVNLINGIEAAQATPYSRAVQLSLLPPSGLQTIVLNKTSRADMDGDAIGGTVDFHTPSAFDSNRAASGSVQAGARIESRAQDYGKDGLGYNFGVDGQTKFGPDHQFGVYASAFYDIRHYANSLVGGVQETGCCDSAWNFAVEGPFDPISNANGRVSAPGLDPGKNLISTGFNVGVSEGSTERWGGTMSLDWKPDDTTSAYARLTYADALTVQNSHLTQLIGQNVQNGQNGLAIGSTGLYQPVITDVQPRFWYETNPEHATLGAVQVGGEKTFSHWTIAPNLFYSWGVASRFDHIEVASRVGPNTGGIPYGGTTLFTYANNYPIPLLTPAMFNQLNNIGGQPAAGGAPELTPQTSGQKKAGFKIDIKYDFDGGVLQSIKFGGKYVDSWRSLTNRDYTTNYGTAVTFSDLGIISKYFAHVFPGKYLWSVPDINQSALFNLFQTTGGATSSTIDGCGSAINSYNCNTQKASEAVASVYAMATFMVHDVEIIPGIRFEHTDIHNTFWLTPSTTVTNPDNTTTTTTGTGAFSSNETHYNEPLPSIFFNYRPNANSVYRAAVWTSYVRPPFLDLGGGASTNKSGTVTTITEGNPNLKPIEAVNYDVSGEWDNRVGGHLMIAGFYKSLHDYIYDNNGGTVNSSAGVGSQITQPHNGGDGTVYGVEMAVRQKFQDMPAPLDGIGVSGNITRQWTSVDLGAAVVGKQRIQNAPDLMANAELFYEKHGLSLDLIYNYTGEYVATYDTLNFHQGWDNVWVRPTSRLDLHAGYKYRNWKVDVSIANLLKTESYWSHIGKDSLAISDIVNSGSTTLVTLTTTF